MRETGSKLKDLLEDVLALNIQCFGKDDYYSTMPALTSFVLFDEGDVLVEKDRGVVVGYLLLDKQRDGRNCTRRGVSKTHRRKGLGLKLTKRAIKLAAESDLPYRTYTAHDNLASLNSNIRAGLTVTRIDEWVHLSN